MRMFAWVDLLADDGYATRLLSFFQIDTLFRHIGLLDQGAGWLDGQSISVIMALVYGYVPYLILPGVRGLDRIDQRVIEAARDLGGSPASASSASPCRCRCRASSAALVLIMLPMFGDYYTNDLISALAAHEHARQQVNLAHPGRPAEEPRRGDACRAVAAAGRC